jgi:dTDP-4-amino-4,6-dideoxygalactose transaminase
MNYHVGDFPVAERVASEILSLPMFPQLTAQQQFRVAEEILTFTSRSLSQGTQVDLNASLPSKITA